MQRFYASTPCRNEDCSTLSRGILANWGEEKKPRRTAGRRARRRTSPTGAAVRRATARRPRAARARRSGDTLEILVLVSPRPPKPPRLGEADESSRTSGLGFSPTRRSLVHEEIR